MEWHNSFKVRFLALVMDNYVQLIERICRLSGIAKEEIERKIEAKRAKLSGLVSKEGAAQIVAAECGINLDQERLKISQLVHGMRANILGKVIDVFPIRTFVRQGREGKVAKLLIADESSNMIAVLWDTHHISLIESGKVKKDSILELSQAQVRNGELHLSSFSDIKLSQEKVGEVVIGRQYPDKKLKDMQLGERLRVRGTIVQTFAPRSFLVCPNCGKKSVEGKCAEHGDIVEKKRAVLTIVVDDGTETARCVLFGEQAGMLGIKEEELFSESFNAKDNSLLGEEKFFAGNVRNNDFSQSKEFVVESVSEVNPEELIKEFERKA